MIRQDTVDDIYFQLAELQRRLAMLIVPGAVKSYDPKTDTAQVAYALDKDGKDVVTFDVPNGGHAGTAKSWRPLKVGQQVTLFCPSGEIANAFVHPGGFHDQNPAPSRSGDEDILATRGDDTSPVRFHLTDSVAQLDNQAKKTAVRAGDGVAELENSGEKSAVRAKKNGVVTAEVTDVTKFKIVINGRAYYVDPAALRPTDL